MQKCLINCRDSVTGFSYC